MLEKLEIEKYLELNAKLQQKKNNLRKLLKEKGILKKGAKNDYDNYKYFSEAQYKELFTELFSKCKLELKFNEIEYTTFEGTTKQANGRMPKLEFTLFDAETGFYENTTITGEAIDKGDKAGYKAYTGALKYYLANTFMVATGDDPEKESPSNTMNKKNTSKGVTLATEKQKELIKNLYSTEEIKQDLIFLGKSKLSDLTIKEASDLIGKKKNEQESPGDFREVLD